MSTAHVALTSVVNSLWRSTQDSVQNAIIPFRLDSIVLIYQLAHYSIVSIEMKNCILLMSKKMYFIVNTVNKSTGLNPNFRYIAHFRNGNK